ncbi:MAG: glycine--tRNA ligase subunit beta [Gammaproteobacteria bacterium]|jgi:glycyl-tRNA synthetase beta chain|nr:glycine--tRNA ligase subunit beta [Gammaproteobacteria bacterium]
MSTRDFLFELGTEELPPLALPELEQALKEGLRSGLESAGLSHGDIVSYAAPRRLAVLVLALIDKQPEQQIKRRGPPVSAAFDKSGAPTRAATAFAETCGVALEQLGRVIEGKGEFLYFEGSKPGAATAALLPAMVQAALDALPIPKRMRWGTSEAEFVRPVHWIVMRFGHETLHTRLLDTEAGATTRGHRFHAPQELAISSPAEYADTLRSKGFVLASFAERRERIRDQVLACAKNLGGKAVLDDALLDEVTALVEWPVAIEGRFDERFLALPREVLISTLQEHQRYFAVENTKGELTNHFITVSNIESRDPSRVRAGNERVVRPRLADAAFFHEQDRRNPLHAWRQGLDSVTFQAKLGSIGDKLRRVVALTQQIAPLVGADAALASRAAELSKCDLLSAMVGEFPELQGVMGAYYAAADGEDSRVAAAIRDHYLPRGAGDALPADPVGVAVALADKLDTLAGIFGIGQKPSGTKDPFALRRAAIGVLRIILERQLDLDLGELVGKAVSAQPVTTKDTANEVLAYLQERMRAHYLEAGYPAESFEAVLATGTTRALDFDQRMRALAKFRERPEAETLAAANKRIANILRKSSAGEVAPTVEVSMLGAEAEKALHQALEAVSAAATADIAARRYDEALAKLASLRPSIDAFFNDVMVNDPNAALRANRLALVSRVRDLFTGVADFSKLPG